MTNPKSDCWIWKRHRNKRGYGVIQIRGKSCLVHRIAFHLFNGPLYNMELVCHRCDNPPCWNPKHLFKGTQKENIRDCHLKGRNAPQDGNNNNGRKLNSLVVSAIRDIYKTGNYSQRCLALRFGVTQSAIYCVLKNKSWRKTNANIAQ